MRIITTPIRVYQNEVVELHEKLHRKKPKFKFWSLKEIKTLISLYNQGYTTQEIATNLGRTFTGTSAKLYSVLHDQELIDHVTKTRKK